MGGTSVVLFAESIFNGLLRQSVRLQVPLDTLMGWYPL
jgi:hypothetical protein